MNRLDRKFWSDTVWNYFSLGIQACVGIGINVLILLKQGSASLGVFNQIYAVFVIAGQIAVFGLHDSALKHTSQYADNPEESHALSLASAAVALMTGLASALFLALFSPLLGRAFDSPEVGRGILLVAPGLCLFTLNKVLMGLLNGQRRMRAFAAGLSIRALAIFLVCFWIVRKNLSPHAFGYSFTLAEIILAGTLLFWMRPLAFRKTALSAFGRWMLSHLSFGSRALVHGFLSESFIRIDILMLGIYLSDRLVGIYSFAAFFLEGAYQVSIVVRNITNPILVRLLLLGDILALSRYNRRTALLSFGATALVVLGILLIYPHLDFWMPADVIQASYPALLVLMGGLVIYSFCVPFDYIFLQAGRPGMQSIYMFANAATNVFLNALLIPVFGLLGAAAATAVSFVFACFSVNVLSSRILDLPGGLFHLSFFRAPLHLETGKIK